MNTSPQRSRRLFLASASGAAASVCTAGLVSACGSSPNDRHLVFASLDDAMRELARLTTAQPLKPATAWTWPRTLVHCAQSIEFSMQGFPEPKPAIFQRTLGAAAFNVFAWRGRMTHDLGEPIPGAAALESSTDVALASARLQQAVQAFQATIAPLRPHFAYGELSKSSYGQAHAMHLANHFSAFDLA